MKPRTRYASHDGVFAALGRGTFGERGKRTLKGIAGEWRFYEAVL